MQLLKKLTIAGLYYCRSMQKLKRMARAHSVILMYHGVTVKPPHTNDIEAKNVYITDFEEQIRLLQSSYNVISLTQLVTLLLENKIRGNEVVITFDDGYKNNYENAFPILQKYNVPAIVFLATDYIANDKWLWVDKIEWIIDKTSTLKLSIDTLKKEYAIDSPQQKKQALATIKATLKAGHPNLSNQVIKELHDKTGLPEIPPFGDFAYLSWHEIAEMSKAGIEFGAHTKSHPILSKIPIEDARDEILSSKQIIEKMINKPIEHFCYPNGKIADINDAIKAFCQTHFLSSVSTERGYISRSSFDLFALKRVGISYDISIYDFSWQLFKNT